MIILDTHIWIWWVQDEKLLTPRQIQIISQNEEGGIGISSINVPL